MEVPEKNSQGGAYPNYTEDLFFIAMNEKCNKLILIVAKT